MNDHITGDTPGAEGTPSATRIAHIARVRSKKIQGTMSIPALLEATRTSTNLRRHTERVQEVLAQYGENTVDPSDPKGRTYYDIASQTMPALIPGVDCPDGTPRSGIDCRYHSGCYAIDVNKDLTPELLPIVRQVLEQWPHTTLVSRSVSHQGLWALLHGPRATSDHACTHYQRALMEMLPDSVRPHVAEAPSDLTRARHWAWDPEAVKGPDIEAVLYPPSDPDEPHHGTNGEVPPKYDTAAACAWQREKAESALEYVPLGDDSDLWCQVAMALIHEDVKRGVHEFDGCSLFTEWTGKSAADGSTKSEHGPGHLSAVVPGERPARDPDPPVDSPICVLDGDDKRLESTPAPVRRAPVRRRRWRHSGVPRRDRASAVPRECRHRPAYRDSNRHP